MPSSAVSGTLLLYDDLMVAHDPGAGHPERPERLVAVQRALERGRAAGTRWAAPSVAPREAVERVHEARYVEAIEGVRGRRVALDADTRTSIDTVDAAYLAAGAAIDAVDAVFGGAADNAMALVRPPGHHAEASRAMGFCFFNNVAIAAEHARAAHGAERVLIIDWDVHHGNGTQHAFEKRRDVLFFSTHQYPFYPGTGGAPEVGFGPGEGYTVNVPITTRMGDGEYAAVFADVLEPIAMEYDPDLVLVSAGFDAHVADPLGGMAVTDEGFAVLCAMTKRIAQSCAGGRLALLLEGGYDLDGLASSVRACVEVLEGSTPPEVGGASLAGGNLIKQVLATQRRYRRSEV